LILNFIIKSNKNNIEGFEDNKNKSFITKLNDDIYDFFYSNIYDKLVLDEEKNLFEVASIIDKTNLDKNSKILDLGSGTGHHVNLFNEVGFNCIGVDKSSAMIELSKKKYPNYHYIQKDINNSSSFNENSFSHITCFYFTIYYFKDKDKFFENCYKWLKPKGYLVIHLVNKDKFDPLLPVANPFYLVSPQKYAYQRLTSSKAVFDNFEYFSNFNILPDSDIATFKETFKFRNKDTRINEHTLNMETQENILKIAKKKGFNLKHVIDLAKCYNEKQYLYVLQK
jgi:ubiquinone/menaquinone biosynthesis C-methylase UbiE